MADDLPPDPPAVTPDVTMPEVSAPSTVVVAFPDGKRQSKFFRHGTEPKPPAPPAPAQKPTLQPGDPMPPVTVAESKLPVKLTKKMLRERRAERRRMAYDLWLKDWNLKDIGRALDVSAKTIHYYLAAYTASLNEPRDHHIVSVRQKYVAQLAMSKRYLWMIVADPRASNEDRIMALTEVRMATAEQAKLEGVHMPMKVASTTPDGERWAPLAVELVRRLSDDELKVARKLAQMRLLPSADVIDVAAGE